MGKRKGFTLAELIVVMAIVGILSAVAVPNYTKYVQDAKNRQIEANGVLIKNATLAAIIESQTKGEKFQNNAALEKMIVDRVKHTLPELKLVACTVGRDNTWSSSNNTWRIHLSPNYLYSTNQKWDGNFTSVDEIGKIQIVSGNNWGYSGNFVQGSSSLVCYKKDTIIRPQR